MLEKLTKDIDKELKAFLKDSKKSYGLSKASGILSGGILDFMQRKGKRIRPLFFLLSYLGYTKRRKFSYKKLLRSCLSMELLHGFALVHDDVIDKSALRRGKPTLHRVFNKKYGVPAGNELGPNLSIVAGDIIFAIAFDALFSSDEELSRKEKALHVFIRTAALTATGEYIDVVNGIKKIDQVTKKDVFLTYILKTAKYTFECPLLAGAILAGADSKELLKLSRIGITLGEAFQIQDDILDMFSTSKRIGKPVLSDLEESKKTLLVWKAYRKLKGNDKKTLKRLLEKEKKTHKDLLKLRELVITSGAHKYCLKRSLSLLAEANSTLARLKMKKKHKAAIEEFLQKLFSQVEIPHI